MLAKMFKKYLKRTQSSVDVFNTWVKLFERNDYKALKSKIRKSQLNPHNSTINGLTPLHIACIQGNINAIKFLLEYDVKIDVKSDMGNTPIDEALFYDYFDCMDILLCKESKEFSSSEDMAKFSKTFA